MHGSRLSPPENGTRRRDVGGTWYRLVRLKFDRESRYVWVPESVQPQTVLDFIVAHAMPGPFSARASDRVAAKALT